MLPDIYCRLTSTQNDNLEICNYVQQLLRPESEYLKWESKPTYYK